MMMTTMMTTTGMTTTTMMTTAASFWLKLVPSCQAGTTAAHNCHGREKKAYRFSPTAVSSDMFEAARYAADECAS